MENQHVAPINTEVSNTSYSPELVVSVIMSVFNGCETVAEAIQSVLAQDFDQFELLICDDASSDHTVDILSKFTDPRIRLFKNSTNRGLPRSRNFLMQQAKGKWIAFLDADDIFLPNKLSKSLQAANSNDATVIFHAMAFLGKDGQLSGHIPATERFPSAFLVSVETLQSVGNFREDLPAGADTDFFSRIMKHGKIYYAREILSGYRLCSNSITDKYWFDKRLVSLWYKEHKAEPLPASRDIYIQWFRSKPLAERIQLLMSWYGRRWGRRAAASYFSKRYIHAAYFTGLSLLFNPYYLFDRLRTRSHRSPSL